MLKVSARTGEGIETFWETVLEHRRTLEASGEIEERRHAQDLAWMWSLVEDGLRRRLAGAVESEKDLEQLKRDVKAGVLTPVRAADRILFFLDKK